MSEKAFHEFEEFALIEAGEAGGRFLDSIGKTDMATLTREQWREFLRRIESQRQDTLANLLSVSDI